MNATSKYAGEKGSQRTSNILIVDDHILFRQGLIGLLRDQPDFKVIGEVGTASEAVAVAAQLKPDLILLDIGLPDSNGLEVIQAIQSSSPRSKIVILTVHVSDDFMLIAMSSGAKGYILKNTSVSTLLASLRALERGEPAISRSMTSRVLDELSRLAKIVPSDHRNATPDVLSARELEVLGYIGANATNHEIASQLSISVHTVKIHVHNTLSKLNLPNRREAARVARRWGLRRSRKAGEDVLSV